MIHWHERTRSAGPRQQPTIGRPREGSALLRCRAPPLGMPQIENGTINLIAADACV